jgi:hypothetical protein
MVLFSPKQYTKKGNSITTINAKQIPTSTQQSIIYKTDNKFFENLEKSTYLTTVMKKSKAEQIRRIFYHLSQNFFSEPSPKEEYQE